MESRRLIDSCATSGHRWAGRMNTVGVRCDAFFWVSQYRTVVGSYCTAHCLYVSPRSGGGGGSEESSVVVASSSLAGAVSRLSEDIDLSK